ncbi:MAG: DUF4159 domain-containing protein, partial [Deltaproteobacteria bacterium]|nr:DUF4159 domain-containing protein [Deltaproteobacteria bacterium]
MKSNILLCVFCAGISLITADSVAEISLTTDLITELHEAGDAFTFVRVKYDTTSSNWGEDEDWGQWHTWAVDFPAADQNFLRGVRRLTNIHVNKEPVVMRLDDDRIFEYPFLYMLEVGRQGIQLSEKEMRNLREYLLRGGFLFIDDFWGTWQWSNFYKTFSQVLPDKSVVELSKDHQIFHSFYDIDGPQMIPRVHNIENYPEQDIDVAINRAVLDDDGRVMV